MIKVKLESSIKTNLLPLIERNWLVNPNADLELGWYDALISHINGNGKLYKDINTSEYYLLFKDGKRIPGIYHRSFFRTQVEIREQIIGDIINE